MEIEEAKKFIDVNSIHITISATKNSLLIMKICMPFTHYLYFIFSCKNRENAKVIYNNDDEEVVKMRQPSAVYCKYDVSHSFTSIEDCNHH